MSLLSQVFLKAYWFAFGALCILASLGGYVYATSDSSILKECNDYSVVSEVREDAVYDDIPSVESTEVSDSGQESFYRYLPDEGGGAAENK